MDFNRGVWQDELANEKVRDEIQPVSQILQIRRWYIYTGCQVVND